MKNPLVYLEDYYHDQNGNMVFTEAYHLKRGTCCGSGCLHCPYDGITEVDSNSTNSETPIQCPFCFETFKIPIFKEDGAEQDFVYDCEICCRPIQIAIKFSESGEIEINILRQ